MRGNLAIFATILVVVSLQQAPIAFAQDDIIEDGDYYGSSGKWVGGVA